MRILVLLVGVAAVYPFKHQRLQLPHRHFRLTTFSSSERPPQAATGIFSTPAAASSWLSCAALIAGTTVGGGFLALPSATAPPGALPSAVGLIAVWTYLLGCALSLANTIFLIRAQQKQQQPSSDVMQVTAIPSTTSEEKPLSIFSIAGCCLGPIGAFLSAVLFLVLMTATLTAQFSKVGMLLESSFLQPGQSRLFRWCGGRGAATLLFASVVSALSLSSSNRRVERANDVLTAIMLASFSSLILMASQSGWKLSGLLRADFGALIPPGFGVYKTGPWAIPIFLQLLMYSEIIPVVCARLKNEAEVRKAVLVGSIVPLVMCLVWTCVALGLVAYDPAAVAAAAAEGLGHVYDPLNTLLQTQQQSSSLLLVSQSVRVLGFSSITTTVIGSVLCTAQCVEDLLISACGDSGNSTRTNSDENKYTKLSTPSMVLTALHRLQCSVAEYMLMHRKIIVNLSSFAPAALVSAFGSRSLYYAATAFAGEFPCTLLWGLLPPLCNLSLRWKKNRPAPHDSSLSGGRKRPGTRRSSTVLDVAAVEPAVDAVVDTHSGPAEASEGWLGGTRSGSRPHLRPPSRAVWSQLALAAVSTAMLSVNVLSAVSNRG